VLDSDPATFQVITDPEPVSIDIQFPYVGSDHEE
jgi:hypothetical protein